MWLVMHGGRKLIGNSFDPNIHAGPVLTSRPPSMVEPIAFSHITVHIAQTVTPHSASGDQWGPGLRHFNNPNCIRGPPGPPAAVSMGPGTHIHKSHRYICWDVDGAGSIAYV